MKKVEKLYTTLIIMSIIGILIGSFWDLQINALFYNRGSFYSELFKTIGELPVVIIMLLSSGILIRLNVIENRKYFWNLPWIAIWLAFAYTNTIPIPYLKNHTLGWSFISIIIYFIITFAIICKVPIHDSNAVRKVAYIAIISCILSAVAIKGMKSLWGRMRYFHMVKLNDFSGFSPWYLRQSIAKNDIYKSFPSGHSVNASLVALCSLLPFVFVKLKNYQTRIMLAIIVWILLVTTSRIVDGAHFISDISTGVLIGSIIQFVLIKYVFFKEDIKKHKI